MNLILDVCDFLRHILFFVLLFYAQMKFGITFGFAGQPPTADEIRRSRNEQLQRITEPGLVNALRIPFRLLAVAYFTIWLLVDKNPLLVAILFFLTLIPLYLSA
jgi:hypothetical protein